MSPKVSVILPVYNGALFLKEAINSVLNQTFRDFELIILNDDSKDESEKIIKEFTDTRIKYIKNTQNIGLIATLNKGLELASGVYIARMDQDDICLPARFSMQVEYLDLHPDVSVLASRLVIINEKGFDIDYWPDDYNTVTPEQIKQKLPQTNCIGHPTVMFRKEDVVNIRYKSSFKNSEDWALWLSLLAEGKVIAKLPDVLLKYRVHGTGTTVTANRTGVRSKIRNFKLTYLALKISRFNLKGTDLLVLKSLLRDALKSFVKPLLSPVLRLFKINWLRLVSQYFAANKKLSSLSKDIRVIYFFPYYHTGGAERVHASILEAANQKNALVLITGKSEDDALLAKFKSFAELIELDELIGWGGSRPWLIRKLTTYCAENPTLTMFGCNSPFYYQLIPQLPATIKFIDLIHAFLHLNESGPEKWSLGIVPSFYKRIVINQKTKLDFDYLYRAHGIDPSYLNRVECIYNYVESKSIPVRNFNASLNVLYVGRGSEEKRIPLIAEVARTLKQNGLEIEFHFAGNVIDAIPANCLDSCIIHGNITDEKELEALYSKAHFLIMASSREGFPMVIMEAMMLGAVPITTGVGGIPEHVFHGRNGLLINPGTDSELVKQYVNALTYYNSSRFELEVLSKAAHEYALHNFNKNNFFNSYFQLLNQ